jgi:hypothetical protein
VPLEAYALTTLDRVKKHLDRAGIVDPDDDELLEFYINAYSQTIADFTGREFKPQVNDTERFFPYDGGGYLNLAPYELRKPGTAIVVRYGTDGDSPQTLEEGDYRLEPRNGDARTGTYLWLRLPRMGRGAFPVSAATPFDLEVGIRGDWAQAAVPPVVELACVIACANAFRNPEGFESRSLGGFTVTEEDSGAETPGTGLSLPRDARALLSPFIRGGL